MTMDVLGSGAHMASPQVWKKESPAEEERMCNTFCVMKQTENGEREDGSACGKLFEES